MFITFDDQEYSFDIEDITRSEAAYIKRQKGLTLGGLLAGMADLDPDALDGMFWLMLKQNGTVRDINKLPDYPMLKFGEAISEAFAAEDPMLAKDGEGTDPTEAEPAAEA
jgi:hypothetical protein